MGQVRHEDIERAMQVQDALKTDPELQTQMKEMKELLYEKLMPGS
jgi:hypothetical protein